MPKYETTFSQMKVTFNEKYNDDMFYFVPFYHEIFPVELKNLVRQ